MPSVGPSKVGRRTFASNAGVFLRVFSVALGAGIHEHVSRAGERELHGHLSSIQSYFFVPHTQQPSSLASFVFPPSPLRVVRKKKNRHGFATSSSSDKHAIHELETVVIT